METLMYSLAKFGKIKFTGIPFSFKFDALDGNENSDILQNWRRIKLSLSAVLSYLTFIPLFEKRQCNRTNPEISGKFVEKRVFQMAALR